MTTASARILARSEKAAWMSLSLLAWSFKLSVRAAPEGPL